MNLRIEARPRSAVPADARPQGAWTPLYQALDVLGQDQALFVGFPEGVDKAKFRDRLGNAIQRRARGVWRLTVDPAGVWIYRIVPATVAKPAADPVPETPGSSEVDSTVPEEGDESPPATPPPPLDFSFDPEPLGPIEQFPAISPRMTAALDALLPTGWEGHAEPEPEPERSPPPRAVCICDPDWRLKRRAFNSDIHNEAHVTGCPLYLAGAHRWEFPAQGDPRMSQPTYEVTCVWCGQTKEVDNSEPTRAYGSNRPDTRTPTPSGQPLPEPRGRGTGICLDCGRSPISKVSERCQPCAGNERRRQRQEASA